MLLVLLSRVSVGVGTGSPGAKLDVESGSSSLNTLFGSTATTTELALSASGTATAPRIGATGNDLYFKTNGAEQVRINSAGKVGIGANNPISRLHVNEATTAACYATVGNVNNGAMFGVETSGITQLLSYAGNHVDVGDYNGGTPVTRVRFHNSGSVGIGVTAPAGKLHVHATAAPDFAVSSNPAIGGDIGTLKFYSDYSTASRWAGIKGIVPSGAAGIDFTALSFFTNNGAANNAERMRLDSAGSLGLAAGSSIGSGSGYVGNTTASSNAVLKLYDPADGYTRLANGYASGGILLNAYNGYVKVDAQGNIGIKVSPSTWTTGASVIQMGNYGAYGQARGGTCDTVMSWNASVASGAATGTGYVYRNTGDIASAYEQNGAHRWFVTATAGTAGNAISFSQAMTLDTSGNLLVGTTTSDGSSRLQVSSAVGRVASFASTDPNGGYNVFLNGSTTLGYMGSGKALATGGALSDLAMRTESGTLTFANGAAEMARFSAGNLLIGTTSANAKLQIKGVAGSANNGLSVQSPNASQSLDILPGYALTNGTATGVQADTVMTIRSSGSSSGILALATGNNEQARITTTGNLLLGTTGDNGQKLQVNGGATFGSQVLFAEGTSAAPGISFQNDGAPDTGLYHISDGTFGITCNTNPVVAFTSNKVTQVGVHVQTTNGGNGSQRILFEGQQLGGAVRMRIGLDSNENPTWWTYDTNGNYTGSMAVYNGNVNCSASMYAQNFYASSDESLKYNWRRKHDLIEGIATIDTYGIFDWKEDDAVGLGLGAQSLEQILPEAITVDHDGVKKVNYDGFAGYTIVELCKRAIQQEERIAKLEAKLAKLLEAV